MNVLPPPRAYAAALPHKGGGQDNRDGRLMLPLATGLKRVECVAFHPAGGLVAAGGRGVELWDVRAMEPVWQAGWKTLWVEQLAFTPDGRCLLALVPGWRVYMLDTETGDHSLLRSSYTGILAVSRAGDRAVIGNHEGLGSWFPAPIRSRQSFARPVWNWELPSGTYLGAALTAVGDVLLTHEITGGRPRFALRDPTTGTEIRSVRCPFHSLNTLTFSPDGTLLVARLKNELLVWDATHLHRHPRRVRSDTTRGFTDLAFHPSGRYLATTSNDHTVKLFDTATWSITRAFAWDAGRMRSVAFAPDGLTAAAGGEHGQLVLFDVDV